MRKGVVMKKNAMSLLLTVVLAAGSILSAAPARAAETTAKEAVVVQEEPGADEAAGQNSETEIAREDAAMEETVEAEEPVVSEDGEAAPVREDIYAAEEAGSEEALDNEDVIIQEDIAAEAEYEAVEENAAEPAPEEEIETAESNEAVQAGADDASYSGTCGNDAFWTLTDTGVLTISGSGSISDSDSWSDHRSSIKTVIIESGITEIGTYSFENCSNITSIDIPDSVRIIGGNAFKGCKSLTSIEIPEKVTVINGSTFMECSSLESITLPDGLDNIGWYAFYNCSSLSNLTIPDSVRKINAYAFSGCISLESVLIPDSVNALEDYFLFSYVSAFEDYDGLIIVYYGSFAETYCKEKGLNYKAICKEHVWSEDYEVIKEPTLREPGLAEYTCEVCGDKKQEEIPVLDTMPIENAKIRGIKDKTHTGKPVTQDVRIIDGDYTLAEGTDYTLSYENNTDIGLASVTITGEGAYTGSVIMGFAINPAAPKTVRATNVAPGMKLRWDKVEGATSYYVYRDNKFLFRTSALEATDKEVKDKNGVKFTYKVVASAKVDGTDYDSDVFRTTTYYRLIPVGIKSVKNTAAGKMTVTYDKNAKSTGYVVRFGLKSDMSDAKVITVSGAGTLSKTFSGFKKGKTYYVQVRTYKLENGVRYYSGYCTTKTVKITK